MNKPHFDFRGNYEKYLPGVSPIPYFDQSVAYGHATTISPEGISKTRDIWSGRIKVSDLKDHFLIRNVELNNDGKLSIATVALATRLEIPHHQGA